MEIALVSATYCRKTGELLNTKMIEAQEVDEDEFYKPIVEILGDEFLKQYKNKREGQVNDKIGY